MNPTTNNKEKCCEKCNPGPGRSCANKSFFNCDCPCHDKQTPDQSEQTVQEVECDCQSSNRPDIGTIPERVLDPNEYFNWDAKAKKVSIDECIADEVIALWEEGIWTRGSCCGHNDFWDRSIVLDEAVIGVELEKAKRLVSANTKLKQWKLVDVDALTAAEQRGVERERERERVREVVATTFARSPLQKRKDVDADKFYLDILQALKSK